MLDALLHLEPLIGNTPVKSLRFDCRLSIKLEHVNYSGSIKDRAAYSILLNAIKRNEINKDTLIVESSSGNFAIALAMICKQIGLKFIPVIDPNINQENETVLRMLVEEVIKVDKPDHTNGYLLTRIEAVQELRRKHPNSFWTNQYENPDNYLGYYNTMGLEICNQFSQLDYVFIAVSSCGTITGISKRLKEHFPHIKVVAVDVEGSLLFSEKPRKRFVSGIGASKKSALVSIASIDDVVHVTHGEIIIGCRALLSEQGILSGASTGAVYQAIKKYALLHGIEPEAQVLFFSTDKGNSYLSNVYNEAWVQNVLYHTTEQVPVVLSETPLVLNGTSLS
ncbi:cysteine synthase A [Filimonas lacunae]|uniref:Cysteine synthase A n=1 Tax=Filimonas lacunae TaxID=477680 RepID=A0A173MEC6_9BACT|nr:2,3-diaminopropionate biosynthesis protein SbnA [Filimonas lacunae]BAV05925.1 cysteine synthase [Filimonas lacunae]SIT34508.1 cysteine synthase A [Filimonas lacunae]